MATKFRLPASLAHLVANDLADRNAAAERLRVATDGDAIRSRCRTLFGFVKEAWRVIEPETPLVTGWVVKAICDHLEAVTRGEITRLLINVPPGTMKSTLVSIMWPAWEWGPKGLASMRYLATSYSGPNVVRDTTKMRDLVASEWYQALWPNVTPTKKWGEKKIINSATGQREGRPFAKMTGGRGDRVLIDDPHDTENAESEVQRSKTVRIFREQLSDRLNDPEKSAIVVIMQRLHAKDVAGEILRLGLPYVHLNLPMEYEPTRRENGRMIDAKSRTHINGELFFQDPRDTEGELLFPERFGPKAVAELKYVKGSYAWAGQYQQRPTPREGGMFKREWFEPTDGTPSRIINTVPPAIAWVRAWDIAGTAKRHGTDPDYTVGLKMGKMADGRHVIASVVRFQLSPGESEKRIKSTAELDTKAVPVDIPDDPAAGGKYMVRDLVTLLSGWVVRATKPMFSKEARANALAVQAEHGNVLIVRGEWTEAFLDELCNFPNARHDDQVDAASSAFNFLTTGVSDTRSASAGPRRVGALVEESREAVLMKKATIGRGARTSGSRRTGIM
jgi:predicted phage terminase large subunit-like protein